MAGTNHISATNIMAVFEELPLDEFNAVFEELHPEEFNTVFKVLHTEFLEDHLESHLNSL